jgi:hypothetical protein
MQQGKIITLLEWYPKKGKKLVGEEEIDENHSVEVICSFLAVAPEVTLLTGDLLKLTEEQGKNLQPIVSHQFNFSKYEYFICQCCVPEE